jgi:SAM-dependent methyltransferase
MEKNNFRETIKKRYAATAKHSHSCGCTQKANFVDPEFIHSASRVSGYSEQQLDEIPDGANLGLGCGNPVALAVIRQGDVVLDLGSGAGMDCFLASKLVGDQGRVIGVDMTPEMVDKARENAEKNGYRNVEFRLGEIEKLPVESFSVDVIISNCVINLSTDKPRVFQEAYRVLKPGGMLLVSDIALLEDLPDYVRNSPEAYIQCIAGALRKDEYLEAMHQAGFDEISIIGESSFPAGLIAAQPRVMELIGSMNIPMSELQRLAGTVVSLKVSAKKAERH